MIFICVKWKVKPEHADHLRLTSYCGAGHNRALADAGVLDIHPHPYSRLGALIRARAIPADVVLIQVSPPNAKGEFSLGLAAEYLVPALEACRAIVAEVNERIPWTYTDRLLRDSDFALADSAPSIYLLGGRAGSYRSQNCSIASERKSLRRSKMISSGQSHQAMRRRLSATESGKRVRIVRAGTPPAIV